MEGNIDKNTSIRTGNPEKREVSFEHFFEIRT
jgi:hypothetical protein